MPEMNQTLVDIAPVDIAEVLDALECDPAFRRELEKHTEERIDWLRAFVPAAPEFV